VVVSVKSFGYSVPIDRYTTLTALIEVRLSSDPHTSLTGALSRILSMS
jgi:hypothetical protein